MQALGAGRSHREQIDRRGRSLLLQLPSSIDRAVLVAAVDLLFSAVPIVCCSAMKPSFLSLSFLVPF
jgi:hypothetical protein